jgi:hypothetical protein
MIAISGANASISRRRGPVGASDSEKRAGAVGVSGEGNKHPHALGAPSDCDGSRRPTCLSTTISKRRLRMPESISNRILPVHIHFPSQKAPEISKRQSSNSRSAVPPCQNIRENSRRAFVLMNCDVFY